MSLSSPSIIAQETMWKRRQKDQRIARVPGIVNKLNKSQLNSPRMRWQANSLHGSVPDHLHIYCSFQFSNFRRHTSVRASESLILMLYHEAPFLLLFSLDQQDSCFILFFYYVFLLYLKMRSLLYTNQKWSESRQEEMWGETLRIIERVNYNQKILNEKRFYFSIKKIK